MNTTRADKRLQERKTNRSVPFIHLTYLHTPHGIGHNGEHSAFTPPLFEKHLYMNKSMRHLLVTMCILPLLACGQNAESNAPGTPAKASTEIQQTISQKLEKTYQNQGLKVLSVKTTPISGLYEVTISGNQVVYVDGKADYMLVGDLLDLNNRKSLTEARMAELSKINFNQLPLDDAIKEVRGNGKRVVAVFGDPDCPFCKKLEQEFAQMTDVTIYTFLLPIPSLHPQAQDKSVQIWCQADRSKAWTEWMRHNNAPKAVPNCTNPVAKTMALGEKFGFNGTPTMIFPNGKTVSGYLDKAALEQALNQNQK